MSCRRVARAVLVAFTTIAGAPASTDVPYRIACAQERGESMGECAVQVTREEDGTATVVARFANGFSRSLFFVNGEFLRANATMSGSGSDTDWQLEGGVHRIRADDQRYEIPAELVTGDDPRS